MKKYSCISVAAALVFAAAAVFGQGGAAPYTPRLVTWASGLSRPILLRSAKDGSKRIFVVQQTGKILVYQPGSTTPTTFIDLSSKIVVPTSSGDERGLLGLTFHPQFATNGKFYVDFTKVGTGATVVDEFTTVGGTGASNQGDISTERQLFTVPQPFSNHNGGMVEFGPDGYLYIGMGDGGSGNDPNANAQNKSFLLGKMLRIDPNSTNPAYLIPPGNPYTGAGTARCDTGSTTAGTSCQELWTIGMRNPWRWSFDRGGTHQHMVADVGQGAVEELDILNGGGNYGWRVYEGTTCTGLDPGLCVPGNFVMPYFTYTHSSGRCSVTGGYVYRGTQGSLPEGAYTYADYCSGEIWYWLNNAQTLLVDTPRSVVSFGEDEDGEIYVCYSNGQIDKITRAKASADFDGDLKTDLAVYRPSETYWYIQNSSNGSVTAQQFGDPTDVPVPEDYDGDNITDIAVFRPSMGAWFYLASTTHTLAAVSFGSDGDIPAAGDYDGDAKADFTVFRPSNGVWYTYRSSDNGFQAIQFGTTGDVPQAGDFDGDGKADICVWRPSNGVWYRLNSMDYSFDAVQFGTQGDIPDAADMDGDGRLERVVFRPSNGVWYSLSTSGTFTARAWGQDSDIPAAGDYDGDGKDDVAVFRPSTGVWYALRSSNSTLLAAQFGTSSDSPAPHYDIP